MNNPKYHRIFRQMFWDVWPKMVLGQTASMVLSLIVATPNPPSLFLLLHTGFAIGLLALALGMAHLVASKESR